MFDRAENTKAGNPRKLKEYGEVRVITPDLLHAMQALCQLSYSPVTGNITLPMLWREPSNDECSSEIRPKESGRRPCTNVRFRRSDASRH